MKIQLSKFGDLLVSRPAGHDASLSVSAYQKPQTTTETIELDFDGVLVMAPSWLDEFINGIKQHFPNPIVCLPSSNESVIESLKFVSTT